MVTLDVRSTLSQAFVQLVKSSQVILPVGDASGCFSGLFGFSAFFTAFQAGVPLETESIENWLEHEYELIYQGTSIIPAQTEKPLVLVNAIGTFVRAFFPLAYIDKNQLPVATHFSLGALAVEGLFLIGTDGEIRFADKGGLAALRRNEPDRDNDFRALRVFPDLDLGKIMAGKKVLLGKVFWLPGGKFIGSVVPLTARDTVIGAMVVLRKTEQYDLAQELEQAQELNDELDAIIESCHDSIVVVDVVNGEAILRRINPACERITGLQAEEIVGKRLKDIENEAIISESVSLKVLNQKRTVTILQRIRTGREVMYTGTPIFGDDGQVKTVVCTGWDLTELNSLRQALSQTQEEAEKYKLELDRLRKQHAVLGKLVAKSAKMERVLATSLRVASTNVSILLLGESGVGKDLLARAIHDCGDRKNGPFVKVDCGAIPESLVESELFGYREGAFTGASRQGKPGLLEMAHGGTVFLDEVGELPLSIQPKLLRFLQDDEIQRVGDIKPKTLDVRVIAATNRKLEEMVKAGTFREDLFYRLNVIPILVPPLRERVEDIIPLIMHFLTKYSKRYSVTKEISPEVVNRLLNYDWPGNIRELENVVQRMIVVSQSPVISLEDLPLGFLAKSDQVPQVSIVGLMPLRDALQRVEQILVRRAYLKHKSIYRAAEELGVHASTISRKMHGGSDSGGSYVEEVN